jgi:hypothetical protein
MGECFFYLNWNQFPGKNIVTAARIVILVKVDDFIRGRPSCPLGSRMRIFIAVRCLPFAEALGQDRLHGTD